LRNMLVLVLNFSFLITPILNIERRHIQPFRRRKSFLL